MSKTIAIMQPTYLPWLGYLAMINRADYFVFLDNVQFDKRSWQQRNRIKNAQGALWLTVPVLSKEKFHQKINDVVCQNLSETIKKHLSSISHSYKKAKEYNSFYPFLEKTISEAASMANERLSAFNIYIIKKLCAYSGIESDFYPASHLDCSGVKDELLSNICKFFQLNCYISPPGSVGYLKNSSFFETIDVVYHEYCEPEYLQLYGEHIMNLSCLDAFFSIPQGKLKAFILRGVT
jgi:hypothetical protein